MSARYRAIRVAVIGAALLAAVGWRAADGTSRNPPELFRLPDTELMPLAWSDLDGWAADDHAAAFATLLASCRAILPQVLSRRDVKPMTVALAGICRRARAALPLPADRVAAFFEENFRPFRISRLGGDGRGFLTGYYEPIIDGARVPGPEFATPMYRKPDDLLPGGKRLITVGFPNKGQVWRHRPPKHKLVPYFDRGEIEDGALDGRNLEICWVKDPIEAFFTHIQGSARVRLADGSFLRLNYESNNGQPYTPIGRILIEHNVMPRDEMSLDRIRRWMLANPEEGRDLRRQDKGFIFFHVADLANDDEALGAEGISLNAGRSIAVDKNLHAYGTPFWIEAELPIAGNGPACHFRRLMIAQDTGSAIVGPARADLYFGAGDEAGHMAGRIRNPGRFVMLVPRELDPSVATAHVPIPRPRPVVAAAKRSPAAGSTDSGHTSSRHRPGS